VTNTPGELREQRHLIRFAGDLGEWSLLPPGLLGCPRGPLRVVGGQRVGEVRRGVFRALVDGLSGLRIEFGVARLHLLHLPAATELATMARSNQSEIDSRSRWPAVHDAWAR